MTTLQDVRVQCPKCQNEFVEMIHPSVCTWLNPGLIQDIYDKGYVMTCPHCEYTIRVIVDILINAPSGMFFINTGYKLEDIRGIFRKLGIVNEDGKVLSFDAQQELKRQGTQFRVHENET